MKNQKNAKFIEEPLLKDRFWGEWEGKTITEACGEKDWNAYLMNP